MVLQRKLILLLPQLRAQAVGLRMVRPSPKHCAYELQTLTRRLSLTLPHPDGHTLTQHTCAPRTTQNCDQSDGTQLLFVATFSIEPPNFFSRLGVFRVPQFFQNTYPLLAPPMQRLPLSFALGSLLSLACKSLAQLAGLGETRARAPARRPAALARSSIIADRGSRSPMQLIR